MIPTLPALLLDFHRPAMRRGGHRVGPHSSSFLLPVDLKVDYDRDGEDDILGDPGDTIPQDERFRFWINDDRDSGEGAEAADLNSIVEDSQSTVINGQRDLEDSTRLHVDLSSVQDLVESGDMEVGLKMRGGGSIGVHYAADNEGGSERYLFEQQEADRQCNPPTSTADRYKTRVISVNNQESWFPVEDSFLNSRDDQSLKTNLSSEGILYLIFEGITEGEGEIVLILRPKNGSTVEGPSVPIKLLPVAKMFEHWTASPTGQPSNSVVGDREAVRAAIGAIPANPSKTLDSGVFDPNGPEEDEVIVFVHGWRMEPWNQTSFGETSFKRLWHCGFKGKFFNFSWPTGYTPRTFDGAGWPEDFDNYADSEEIAYHVGEKTLKNFLNYLHSSYPGKVNLFAHSMGGIVSSTAFKNGGQVNTYAACQTAMVGHAYDPQFEGRTRTWETPEVYADFPPTEAPYFESITSKTFNFYNRVDDALLNWRHGQNWKPNSSEGYSCHAFDPALNDGNFLYNGQYPPMTFPSDTYEIYAHCAEGRSYPLGARFLNGAKGNLNLQLEFSESAFNFTDGREDHSGQWNGTLMIRHEFWRFLLLDAFGLNSSKEDLSK